MTEAIPLPVTPAPPNPWSGTIARIGVESVDGRTITAMTLARLSRPRSVLGRAPRSGDVEPIGSIDTVGVAEGGAVTATGFVLLPPGVYPVGVDLRAGETEVEETPAAVKIRMSGELLAVTVYDTDQAAAWEGVEITVTEAPA